MEDTGLVKHQQASAYSSPWTKQQRIKMLLWQFCWTFFCAWTPKPFKKWRNGWLRLFGAKIIGAPFVHQSAKIQIPWNLELHDHACLGDGTVAYSLGKIVVEAGATVAQEAYLCTGTHDFSDPKMQLMTAPVVIGKNAFIGARAFICPGITVGEGAVVGAMSVVTKNVAPWQVVAGNPAKVLKSRKPFEVTA